MQRRAVRRSGVTFLTGAIALALVAAACTSGSGTKRAGARKLIPQPAVEGLKVAPESARVDLVMPSFTHPTRVSNPLFPVSKQASVLFLGRVDNKPFRTEVTLLPQTRIIEWAGQRVETLVSQYVAFLDERLDEVAYDYYAQDDTGAVWYFGEDVFNFADGAIVDTHGTWLAGRDGPAAMIMPARPKVGDVYRTENVPGCAFEEVTVKEVGRTLDGPLGPVQGGLVVEELHMDAGKEAKTFAPGYGEYFTAGGGDVEPLALAVPTDALKTPTPAELVAIEAGARDAFSAAGSKTWSAAASAAQKIGAAWNAFATGGVNTLIAPRMRAALDRLTRAVAGRSGARTTQAAIDVARLALDLQLRYRPVTEIDLARFDLWAAQLIVDATAKDEAGINHDVFALDYVRDRLPHAVDTATLTTINKEMEALQVAREEGDPAGAADVAAQIRGTVKAVLGR